MRSTIATFHSLCVRLLRREAAAAGLPSGFLIYFDDFLLRAQTLLASDAAVRESWRRRFPYSWRGADIQNILDFEHEFPGARVFRLEESYRSSQAMQEEAGPRGQAS